MHLSTYYLITITIIIICTILLAFNNITSVMQLCFIS